jgi:formylglycine-generating enzyme required for sulfatase activity
MLRSTPGWSALALAATLLAGCGTSREKEASPPGAGAGTGGSEPAASGGSGGSPAGAPNPSCEGLDPICGPDGQTDCCASSLVPGGTFLRDNGASGDFVATVSDFRLDLYEVTVGRFRKFVEGYAEHRPAPGSGKNPNNPDDPGWDPEWDASLPPDEATLREDLQTCQEEYLTFTAGDDRLPINCITWFVAYAFCIWDNGRLPTDAEWNYAAVGGTEQRFYPWSVPPDDQTLDPSYAVYYPSADGPAPVGSKSPAGDGRWGQADLSGNVWEWLLDWYQPYPESCINCANLNAYSIRVIRNGSFLSEDANLANSNRLYHAPVQVDLAVGARCARSP